MTQGPKTAATSRKHPTPLSCRLTKESQKVFDQFCRDQRRRPAAAAEFLVEIGLAVWQKKQLDEFRLQIGDDA